MPKEVLTPSLARALIDERWEKVISRATPEAIATGKHGECHMIQIAIMRCIKQNMIFMCSRRAGKSEVCCGLILLTAIKTKDVSCLYLGLTKDAAEPIWRKWKKLLKRLDIPNDSSDAQQFTEFPNGSRVLFTGTDDLRTISHLLGDQLAGGIAVIDEGQSDPGIMETTVEDTLGPMLDETTIDKPIPGRLVLSGTVPDGPVGYFWQTWINNRNATDTETKLDSLWETFEWSRYENPFQVDNEAREEAYCKKYRKLHSDPAVLRRFRGKRVWAKESNAFRFDRSEHCYRPISRVSDVGPFSVVCTEASNLGADRFIVGIQQATPKNRFAIEMWGWNSRLRNQLWQIAEAVTEENADPLDREWIAVCAMLRKMYRGSMEFIRDSDGSSDPVNEALKLSHGIEMNSAIKTPGATKARVQLLSDLLSLGIAKVIEGSQLDRDMTISRWAPQLRSQVVKWELDKTHGSPAAALAASYAFDLQSYTRIGGMKPPAKRPSLDEYLAQEQKKTIDQLTQGKLRNPPPQPAFVNLWLPPPK